MLSTKCKLYLKIYGSMFLVVVINLFLFEFFGGFPVEDTVSRLIIEGVLGVFAWIIIGAFIHSFKSKKQEDG